MIEPGRVCIKLRGREAGKRCIIEEIIDENFVIISGEGVRRRRCNIKHLLLLPEKVEVPKKSKKKSEE
jgi:large subunit ribosomal protein L14e